MTHSDERRRATVHDVARQAGVSLATVDRVLNGRAGVRPAMVARVKAAIAELGFRRDQSASMLARSRDLQVHFILTLGSDPFMGRLGAEVQRQARLLSPDRLHITSETVPAFNGRALATALEALEPSACDCVVVVASEHKEVGRAVDAAVARGLSVLTLVSDLPDSARAGFIGIDNLAAGRTAASLMGRFLPAGGRVGIVVGSLDMRHHRQRLEGFVAVASAEYPDLVLLGPEEGHDDRGATMAAVASLVADYPDIAGIYSIGAGSDGLIEALDATRRSRRVRVIAHELTGVSRKGLLDKKIDVIIDQDPEAEVRAAVAAARQLAMGSREWSPAHPIEFRLLLRDNLGKIPGSFRP